MKMSAAPPRMASPIQPWPRARPPLSGTPVFYEYHPEHAEACIAHLANAACGAQSLDGGCAQALVDIAGHGPGSQCGGSASLTLCNNGLYCAGSTNAACGMCTADKTAGQACVNDYPTGCGAGLFCDAPSGGSGVCTAERLAGETCANGGCTGALDCRTSTGAASTCQPRVGQGAGCEDALCYYDFVCSGTSGRTCKVPLANGVSCTRQNEDPPCAEYCAFSAPDAATGTCGTPPDELSGQPCPYAGTYASCGFGHYASKTESNGTVTSCVCMAELQPGAACPDYGTCTTVCEGADPNANRPVMGTCAQPKANGTECLNNGECASGECSYQGSPAICAEALTCNP